MIIAEPNENKLAGLFDKLLDLVVPKIKICVNCYHIKKF